MDIAGTAQAPNSISNNNCQKLIQTSNITPEGAKTCVLSLFLPSPNALSEVLGKLLWILRSANTTLPGNLSYWPASA